MTVEKKINQNKSQALNSPEGLEFMFDHDGRGEEYEACAICGNATLLKLLPILGLCVFASFIALAGYSAIIGKPKWLRGSKHSN